MVSRPRHFRSVRCSWCIGREGGCYEVSSCCAGSTHIHIAWPALQPLPYSRAALRYILTVRDVAGCIDAGSALLSTAAAPPTTPAPALPGSPTASDGGSSSSPLPVAVGAAVERSSDAAASAAAELSSGAASDRNPSDETERDGAVTERVRFALEFPPGEGRDNGGDVEIVPPLAWGPLREAAGPWFPRGPGRSAGAEAEACSVAAVVLGRRRRGDGARSTAS